MQIKMKRNKEKDFNNSSPCDLLHLKTACVIVKDRVVRV